MRAERRAEPIGARGRAARAGGVGKEARLNAALAEGRAGGSAPPPAGTACIKGSRLKQSGCIEAHTLPDSFQPRHTAAVILEIYLNETPKGGNSTGNKSCSNSTKLPEDYEGLRKGWTF